MATLAKVDFGRRWADNRGMEVPGRVQNGVVVLQGGAVLPEGTQVTVLCDAMRIWHRPGSKKQVEFPLVRSLRPGTLNLTNERIAEILQEEDIAQLCESFGRPAT